MNKDEILNRSRQSKKDEGVDFVQNEGVRFGFYVFVIVSFFMVIFNQFIGVKSFDIFALIFVFESTESMTKYKFTHKKRYIISTVVYILLCITCLFAYIDTSLR